MFPLDPGEVSPVPPFPTATVPVTFAALPEHDADIVAVAAFPEHDAAVVALIAVFDAIPTN